MTTRRRLVGAITVYAVSLALAGAMVAGCSVSGDDAPRDIEGPLEVPVTVSATISGAQAIGSGRIYLLAAEVPGLPTRLEAVARDTADDPVAILRALFAGPNSEEFTGQLRTALPVELTLNSARVLPGDILVADVSDQILQLSSDVLIGAVAQIVYTGSTIDSVRSVLITVNGTSTRWPAGNGELHERALTVYDFPGLEPSAQPAYPAVPPLG